MTGSDAVFVDGARRLGRTAYLASGALAALVCIAAVPAQAQPEERAATQDREEEDADDLIIITGARGSYKIDETNTATKLPLSLRQTPQSITVIGRQQIEDFNLNTIADVLAQTPGVTTRSLDGGRTSFSARGFAIQNFQIDGVPTAYQSGPYANSALDDISVYERVEVIRGATGLVTGTGDPSATVNLVRKKPTREFGAYVNLTGGSWEYKRIEADVSGPLAADGAVRARIVGAYTDKDTQFDFDSTKSPSLYGVVEADVTPGTLLRAGAVYLRTDQEGASWSAVPLFFTDGTPTDLPRSYSAAAKWNHWERDNLTIFGAVEQNLGGNWTAQASVNYRDSSSDSLLYAGGSGYPNRDGTGVGVWDFYGATEQDEIAFDLYTSGPLSLFGRAHDIVLGANHYDRDFSVLNTAIVSRDYSLQHPDIFDWDGDIPRPEISNTGRPSWIDRTKESGIYGAVRLNLADSVKLIAGGRYTDYEMYRDNYDAQGAFTEESGRTAEQRFTPYGGLTIDLTENLSAFASYASVFNPQNVRNADNEQLPPVTGANYEAGLKADLVSDMLYLSVNGFHMQQDNVSELDPTVPPNSLPDGSSAYRAIAGVKTWGGEIELAGELAPGWTITGGYTYARSEDPDDLRVFTTSPLHIARAFTTYALGGALDGLTIGGGISWQSKIFQDVPIPTGEFNADGTPITRTGPYVQGGYAIVDLMARYTVTERVTIGANVSNLFDKTYYQNVGFFNSGFYGQPTEVLANLRISF